MKDFMASFTAELIVSTLLPITLIGGIVLLISKFNVYIIKQFISINKENSKL